VAASASLFGEWQASIVDLQEIRGGDPNVLRELEAAAAVGDDAWPGATLRASPHESRPPSTTKPY
jgi:hypothetical protein